MDVDFVLHDAPRPAADFARRAKVGGICGISGPCGLGAKPAKTIYAPATRPHCRTSPACRVGW
ncbi:siderophore-interacting protein [Shinella sp. PSBB067]|uniref:siderophore-interacting protein n=1 Tax=Shinella sp. PSBB067 TaxID=2715959 RepID=UPI00351C3ABB